MKKTLICLGLLIFAGCGPEFHVNVDSISSGEVTNDSKCMLLPAEPNDVANQLEYKEYAQYVKRALEKKAFKVTDNADEANVVVFLKYGISEPHESVYSYSTPVWGQTGISSSHTMGSIHSYGGGMASYSGTTTYTPQYGITGYQSHIGTRVTYTRFVILDAYDLERYKETNEEVQLWRTTATSTGSSGDLRLVFPIMVAASSEYIGENTGKQILLILFENDKRVKEIKRLVKE